MAKLIAQWQDTAQILQLSFPEAQRVRLGRAPTPEHGMLGWLIPWDRLISRNHADLVYQNGRLQIQRLPDAKNPIYIEEVEQGNRLELLPGGTFRIGSTNFRFEAPEALVLDDPEDLAEEMDRTSVAQKIYTVAELRATEFGNAIDRMEVFSKLPQLISKSRNDAEFASQLVALLLPTIPLGQAAAVIRCRNLSESDELEFDLVRSVLRDTKKEFRPSRRLVRPALEEGSSRVHMWNKALGGQPNFAMADSEEEESLDDATNPLNLEWAICVPVPDKRRREWCLYVSGRFAQAGHFLQDLEDLKPDVRYIELLAQFVGATRQVRLLQQQQGLLGHFFSPNVVDWLNESHDPEVLSLRQCEITALMCDLRGFSRRAEQARHKLQQLLSHVSEALGVMTRSIFHHDGVVGDYQGDSALGFWGWPIGSPDGPLPACRAALMIQEEFRKARQQGTGPLADLRIGIGIAHGPALAGKIGTEQHAKVGAFGPVVERGSRLESLTKTLRASILMDEATADFAREHLSPQDGRCRRLGRVRLPGTLVPLLVSELLPSVDQDATITDEHIWEYEAAVDALAAGDWSAALKLLDRLPADDRAKDFLMIYIALNDYEPPANWDGVITLPIY